MQRVINCSGPACDYQRITDPLIRNLLDRGDIRPDPLRLGLDVSTVCALRNDRGEIWQRLYAVGPVTRPAFWEVTSVPDIRRQCETLAAYLGTRLASAGQAVGRILSRPAPPIRSSDDGDAPAEMMPAAPTQAVGADELYLW